ncbi:MAG: hypothetical protein ACREDK_08325 [Thermoplasmata archaeon]
MIDPSVVAADALLRKHGIRFAVVGGQAIARDAATATRDVDVMVTTDDYAAAVDRLRQDPDLTLAWEGGAVTRFGIQTHQGVPLDVVDAGVFSGTKTSAEFFEYLTHEQATESGGILYASAEMVWYTRLLTKRWRAYAEKIVTNVIDGISVDRLVRVEEIARRFGTDTTLKERIEYVREELKRPDLGSLVRPE